MPTQPLESILYRDLAKAKAQGLIEIASPLLCELVNYGTNALVRCATSTTGEKNEDLAVLSLYRHILEMTDGVKILVSDACAVPAIPLVRSTFEALLSIEYIIETEADYVRRSLSWLVAYVYDQLKVYESLDASTERGERFQEALNEDSSVQDIEMPPQALVQERIDRLQNLLSEPQFEEIVEEYESLRSPKRWYRLFGGPSNRRELAHHLDKSAIYDFLYRRWSSVSHAHDFSPFILRTGDGEGVIRPIRDPAELKNVANFSATFMLTATRKLIGKFRPGEDLRRWYEDEVRPLYVPIFRSSS